MKTSCYFIATLHSRLCRFSHVSRFVKEVKIHLCFLSAMLVMLFFSQQAVLAQSQATINKRPNILIIMADDLDSKQLSCYGGQNVQTPHIDRLATEGLKFNNLIASEAMCVPTRASLFTGLYPARHGAYQNHKPVYPNLKSVGHYLQAVGYRVALTGKDHVTKPIATFPFEIVPGFEANCVAATDEYFLDSIADFIDQEQPYCLFVMSINPHAPWTVGDPSAFDPQKLILPAHWVDTELTRKHFAQYLAEVKRLDDQVGDVLGLLEKQGQLENTVVIFLGEQGAQFPGGKWNLYDNGQRSSMLIRWPQRISKPRETDAIIQYEDITPTLVDIAGGQSPDSLDGKSFLPVIAQHQKTFRQYAFGIHNNRPEGPSYPIRSIRSDRYKLILNLYPDSAYYIKYMMNSNNADLAYTSWLAKAQHDPQAKALTDRIAQRPAVELYDLKQDPFELKNLAKDQRYQKKIDELKKELLAWMEAQGDRGVEMDVPLVRR